MSYLTKINEERKLEGKGMQDVDIWWLMAPYHLLHLFEYSNINHCRLKHVLGFKSLKCIPTNGCTYAFEDILL